MREMKPLRFFTLFLALCLCVSVLSGCIVLGAGLAAGYVGYEKGALVAQIDHPVEAVYSATLAALDEMRADIVVQRLKRHESKVQFKMPVDHEKGSIMTTALTEYSSRVVIRVGIFGDDIAAQKILDVIREKL